MGISEGYKNIIHEDIHRICGQVVNAISWLMRC